MGAIQTLLGAVGIMPPKARGEMPFAGRTHYDAAGYSNAHTASWWESATATNDEIMSNRELAIARIRSLIRNNPVVSGAIDRLTESVVGASMWMESMPDFEAMGKDAVWADDFATKWEAVFRTWSLDPWRRCDVEMKLRLPEMLRAAYRHWLVEGEALAVVYMRKRGAALQTAVRLVDPDRLSNPDSLADYTLLPNGNIVIGGCEVNRDGATVAYHIRKAHPNSMEPSPDKFIWERFARFAPSGRPQVIHAFRLDRAGQRRGVSRLISSVLRTKMSERYDQAELEAAILNAIYAGFVESPATTSDVRDALAPGSAGTEPGYMESLAAFRAENKVSVNGVRFTHLFPGERAGFHTAERPAANYPAFHAAQDRMLAAGIGLSYPQMSQDWADINYSSARTLLNETWRGFLEDRALFTQEFATPINAAVMEEAAAIGAIAIPGGRSAFYRHKVALVQAHWQGPGRGTIDPLKEEQAADIAMNAGRSNLAIELSNTGRNPREVLQGIARDMRLREQLGVPQFVPLKGNAAAQGDAGGGETGSGGTQADRDGDGIPNEDQRKKGKKAPDGEGE